VIVAFDRDLAERLARIEAASEQAAHAQPFSDDERAALLRAVRTVAEELIAAPP
jgi:hypothetical protein